MALVVITVQDEGDNVSLSFTLEPALPENPEEVTAAQELGLLGLKYMADLYNDADNNVEEPPPVE